ncbi:hypothetical protein [Streptomyces sp. NPDC059928]|uniref:hypothetical protein n=1 Tax=unclassified Streptomyces TaxID=2593676 RepID=UPI00366639D9
MPAVTMLITTELLHEANMVHMLDLLHAEELGRKPDQHPSRTVLTLDIPDAPTGATSIEPVFQRAADGTVSVMSMGWR